MQAQLADLNFDTLIERVIRATDTKRGNAADWIIQDMIAETERPDRVGLIRAAITATAIRGVNDPNALDVSSPLVESLIRVLHHPRRPELPSRVKLASGVDGLPRIVELASKHPELNWDIDRVQRLLIEAVRGSADRVVVDDGKLPWHLGWGNATSASHVLWTFVTLRALGDLDLELTPEHS